MSLLLMVHQATMYPSDNNCSVGAESVNYMFNTTHFQNYRLVLVTKYFVFVCVNLL